MACALAGSPSSNAKPSSAGPRRNFVRDTLRSMSASLREDQRCYRVRVTRLTSVVAPLAWLTCFAACNKPEPSAESPPSDPVIATAPRSDAADATETPPAKITRVDLGAEFHRSRVGAGRGYWVLGMIHNPHAHAVTDARAQVRLLDAQGKIVAESDAEVGRSLAPDARAAVAVLVHEPIEHELLELRATAVASTAEPTPLQLTLEHEPPQRAELGGYFVRGTVSNPGNVAVAGARLEVQGLDKDGRLLGVDWLELDPIAAAATLEFDLGELRYEQAPTKFVVTLLGPG